MKALGDVMALSLGRHDGVESVCHICGAWYDDGAGLSEDRGI